MPEPDEVNRTIRPLLDDLDAQGARISRLRSYYLGKQPGMAYSTARFREAFGAQLQGLAANFMRLVVDCISERLVIQGFRFGGPGNDPDPLAWVVFQRSGFDADAAMAHTDCLITGRCPVMVWVDGNDQPRITIEDAAHCLVRYVPGDRRRRLDGAKRWTDQEGHGRLSYFTAETVKLFRTSQPVVRAEDVTKPQITNYGGLDSNATWKQIDSLDNPFGAVPIVELRPRPQIDGTAASEIEDLLPLQDSINKLLADMMVAAEYDGFRQRWAVGLDVPRDENGAPIQPFSELARLWVSESPDTKFGEFSPQDLSVFTGAITSLIDQLSSIAGIPGHVLARLSGQYPSGEALLAAETSLVDKARRYQHHLGESYEEVIRLALLVLDDPRALDQSAEVIWRDPANHSVGALVDGLLKLQSLGVPQEALWRIYGASPQEIESWRAQTPAPVPASNA